MSNFKKSLDFSPAPRRTPMAVLWAMAAVVIAGSAALVLSVPVDKTVAQSAQSRGHYVAGTPAAKPSTTSSPTSSKAR